MLATVESLFDKNRLNNNSTACKFPARTKWLKEKLSIDNLPKVKCTEYNEWFKDIDPKSVSLIFPSAHINSPASMFGHTFLRIDSSYNSKLLSHAINYAAVADETKENGFIFALKGLFGGYYGKYSLLPYYDKLKEYRDTEQRDIWEYDLNLTKTEVVKMVNHIWELKDAYSDYFFFTENCSYNMLWLIEIAKPSVKLRDKFIFHVSPPETIFAFKDENLIKDIHYRPSKRKKLLAYENLLEDKFTSIIESLSKGELSVDVILQNKTIDNNTKQKIFETSVELCEYYYIQRVITKDKFIEVSYNLSKTRSLLGKGDKLVVDIALDPISSHRQLKVSLGHQFSKNKDMATIGVRPTYHDITNNDNGLLKGTQIEFLNTEFIYNYTDNLYDINYFKLLTISSITPKSKFFNPLSWRTSFLFNRDSLDENLNFNSSIGTGLSWSLKNKHYVYIFVDGYIMNTNYASSAVSNTFGGIFYQGSSFKTNIEVTKRIYNSGDTQFLSSVTQSYYPKQNIDIKLNYQYIEKFNENQNIVKLSINYFF